MEHGPGVMATQSSLGLARIRAASGALCAVAFAAALLASLPAARAADPCRSMWGLA